MSVMHTPGPWAYVGTDPNEGWDGYRIIGERITQERMAWGDIGTVTGPQSNPSSEADARLIAAAPDLLEALKSMKDAAVYNSAASASKAKSVRALAETKFKAALELAYPAIAKATGQS